MKKINKNTKQYLALSIDPASIDSEKRQFKVVVATETPVFRRGWDENFYEILVCNKDNMRTQRMDNGVCPLLDNHDRFTGVTKQYGSLIAYEVSDGEVRAVIQFSKDPSKDGIWKDIEAGIIRGISARYIPWVYERQIVADRNEPNYRAIDWEITEVSLAPVPADFNSMVRGAESEADEFEVVINNFSKPNNRSTQMETKPAGEGQQPNTPEQGHEQTRSQGNGQAAAPVHNNSANESQLRAQVAADERNRVVGIQSAVRTAGLEEGVADELIANGSTLDQARAVIFDKMAEKQKNNQPAKPAAIVVVGDEKENIRAAMSDAILSRAEPGSVKLEGKAHDFRGMSLMDVARHFLQMNGETNPFRFSKNEAVKRAIATTDFPTLLTDTTARTLRKHYEMFNEASWKKISTQTSVSDFRAKTGVKVDGSVTFDKIAEGGEYKASKLMQDAKATISVETFGRLIKITRQAIINDDLDVFSRIPKYIAQAAAMMQAKAVWDLITTPAKTPDGKTLFHADHANLAGAGGALSETTLNAAIVAMAKQKSPAGHLQHIRPKYLIVPVELETAAKKMLTGIMASTTGDVNVFAGAFDLMSEIFLSENSSTAWYLAADPNRVEGLMHAYLDGEEGIYTETRTNFDDDSVETKARLEFGVAAWGHQGFYKNPGA